MTENGHNYIEILAGGGVVVMPTDTIYGLVGQALSSNAVERIYEIKGRAPEKPCIILVSDIADLASFSVVLSLEQEKPIRELWPGPVSIIFDCDNDELEYLHRGTRTLAFRLPQNENLRDLLHSTGPLVAPSANPEGLPPATNIDQAKNYFKNKVDAYVDGGDISGRPSKIIRLHKDGSVTVIRQ